MEVNNKEPGEELLDVDEEGIPIEKLKIDIINKSYNTSKTLRGIIIFLTLLASLYSLSYAPYDKLKKNIIDTTDSKNLQLKNRVIFGPITHDAQIIENIAKNNVAMVITDGAVVGDFDFSKSEPNQIFRIDGDEYISEIKKLADIVHKYHSKILLDLVHLGLMPSEQPLYSPSKDKGIFNKELESKEMTKDDINRIQNYFVQGALRAEKAGYDGIEIHGAHLTLVSLFLSKKYNRRTDEYGGSEENRVRFIVEIVQKIRKVVGKKFIISAKIDSIDEEYGFDEKGFLYTGKALEKAGLDLIAVSGVNPIRNDDYPYFYNDTKKLAETLIIPVVCIGGIKKFEQADYILKNSNIKYIGMSRELLKQPDIVKKWYLNIEHTTYCIIGINIIFYLLIFILAKK